MATEDKRTLSEARKRANAKFNESAYDRIELKVPKGRKKEIRSHAAEYQKEVGEIGKPGYSPRGSMNAFISRAIDATMDKDKADKE